MALPTYQQFVATEAPEVDAAYRAAHGGVGPAPSDLYHNAWRRLVEGMSHDEVIRRIYVDAGVPPPVTIPPPEPTPVPGVFRGRLSVQGEKLTAADGKPFIWRGCTAFRLIELVATGRTSEAVAFMDWAERTGFNLLRVLTMCTVAPDGGMFRLEPAQGREHLPRLLELARARNLYVEVVALAATRRYGFTKAMGKDHLRAIAAICAQHPNAVLQMANEYEDGSQADFVQDPVSLASMSDVIPSQVLYTVSSPNGEHDERDVPKGEYMTRHRSRERDAWNSARRIVEIYRVGDRNGRYIVDDEPTGAGEVDKGGSRSTMPAIFYWQGLGARGHGMGSTFHFQDGLQAKIPGPKQQACAEAFIEGSRLIPDGTVFHFENAQHSTSPVKAANFDREGPPSHEGTVVRVFSFISGGQSFTAALGVTGDPKIVWQNGWRIAGVLKDYPANPKGGLTVWRITK